MEPFSKLKTSEDEEDRISSLPDSIITRILSFLPTRYAVATSALSSNWKHHWTTIDSFDFSEYDAVTLSLRTEGNDYAEGFCGFVERVIKRCDAINIYKFRLCYHGLKDVGFLHNCILFAVKRNVQELELDVLCGRVLEFPNDFFTCKSLRKLKVEIDYLFKVPALMNSFPNLKSLHIQLKYADTNFCRILFSSCPQLVDLLIDAGPCYWKYLQDKISYRRKIQLKKALDNVPLPLSSCFQNLGRLEITIHNFIVRIWLPIFLKISPNLNILILQLEHEKEGEFSKPYGWRQRADEGVPICLLQQLREIRIKSFLDCGVERDVIKFLLDSADVLQRMTIHVKPDIKQKVSEWILALPRASSKCRIEVV